MRRSSAFGPLGGTGVLTACMLASTLYVVPGCSKQEKPPGPIATEGAASSKAARSKARAGSEKYEVVEVTSGGTIAGKVTFAGKYEPLKIAVVRDEETCHTEKESPRLRVGPGGGLADAVVYLEDIRKGKGIESIPAGVLDQKECEYVPHVLIHPIDKELGVASSDAILHNVHLKDTANNTAMNHPFPEATLKPVQKRFRRPGLLRAQCDAGHYWMSAYIFVVEHPYYAVTAADGSFSIPDVPPGTYKLVVWHNGYELKTIEKDSSGKPIAYTWSSDVTQRKDVTVEAGKTATVSFSIGS
jgi:hypothetical protein